MVPFAVTDKAKLSLNVLWFDGKGHALNLSRQHLERIFKASDAVEEHGQVIVVVQLI